jgi:NAD(P)-dependent dehydrogenase (short-subunit alcohol dehydrogenase family)
MAAARRGAKVVLSSRDATDLELAAAGIRADGGAATTVVADVGDFDAVRARADAAIRAYGRIDTWINNAGVSIYGRIEDVPLDDARRLFETNYWGVVHGCRVAVPHLRVAGGALINIGSVLSDVAMPLQGHYAASKHAVKGFTDTLRLELEKEGVPVSVTLVQPASIDTPYTEHARNYLLVEPKAQGPVYAPELVADTILACAVTPRRDVKVGGSAKMMSTMETLSPRLSDRFKGATSFAGQHSNEAPHSVDTLHAPRAGDGRVHGNYQGRVRRRSFYTASALHPVVTVLGAAALGIGVALLARERA